MLSIDPLSSLPPVSPPLPSLFFLFRMNGPLKEKEETSRALVSVSLVSPIHKISDFLFVFFWLTTDGGRGDRLAPTGQLPRFFPSLLIFPCGPLCIFFEIERKNRNKESEPPSHLCYPFCTRLDFDRFDTSFLYFTFKRRRENNRCQD